MKKLLKSLRRYEKRNNKEVYLELHTDESCSLNYFSEEVDHVFANLKELREYLKKN